MKEGGKDGRKAGWWTNIWSSKPEFQVHSFPQQSSSNSTHSHSTTQSLTLALSLTLAHTNQLTCSSFISSDTASSSPQPALRPAIHPSIHRSIAFPISTSHSSSPQSFCPRTRSGGLFAVPPSLQLTGGPAKRSHNRHKLYNGLLRFQKISHRSNSSDQCC